MEPFENYPYIDENFENKNKISVRGFDVNDRYTVLENPSSPITIKFKEDVNTFTRSYLNAKSKDRNKFLNRLKELMDHEYNTAPEVHGNYMYYYKQNASIQKQRVLIQKNMNDGREIVFLDPNSWSNEGLLAIRQLSWTNDGKFLAYGISENGSDWTKIKFIKFDGTPIADEITKVKFSNICWKGTDGIFYSKYPYSQSCVGTEIDKLIFQCLYYHKIGENNDILIYREGLNPDLMIKGTVLYNDRYLFITVIQGFKNKLLYADLKDVKKMDQLKIYPIFDRLDASYEIVAVGGDFLVIFTNFRAPLFKVVKIKFGSNEKPNQNKEWNEIIKEGHNKLERAQFADNKLIIWYLEDMQDQIYLYSLDGILLSKPKFEIGNNNIGIIKEFHVSKDSKIFFGCSSTFTPYLNYEGVIDKKDMNIHPIDSGTIESRYTNDIIITKLLVKGKHYVDIPVQLLHKKDIKLDGNNPVLLYGYGGFNTLESLEFSYSRLIFVNNFNGIFVVANIRGGRERGEMSHGHGSGFYKKNVFEDFIEVANQLIRLKYTNPKRLAIYGVSNGGLLCCACSVLRPDLFNCVVSVVGLTDMLKYDQYTIGASWIPEYGDLRDPNQFNYNYKYSPLHNVESIKPGLQFPASFVICGDHDDRVPPHHSLKFLATIYRKIKNGMPWKFQKNPILGRIEINGGHGEGKPTNKLFEEEADIYAFLQIGLKLVWKDI